MILENVGGLGTVGKYLGGRRVEIRSKKPTGKPTMMCFGVNIMTTVYRVGWACGGGGDIMLVPDRPSSDVDSANHGRV